MDEKEKHEAVVNELREVVFQLLDEERNRQIELGKQQKHAWATWLIIFTDYSGRVAKELWNLATKREDSSDSLIKTLVKTLAVGVAWLEDILDFDLLLESTKEFIEEEEKNASKEEEREGS